MTPEERQSLEQRVIELGNEPTAAAIILLTNSLVGVLDGILNRLRAIEESGDDIHDALHRIGGKLDNIRMGMPE